MEKEVLLKFETQELYDDFLRIFVIPQLEKQKLYPQQLGVKILEWDQQNNIGVISKK